MVPVASLKNYLKWSTIQLAVYCRVGPLKEFELDNCMPAVLCLLEI